MTIERGKLCITVMFLTWLIFMGLGLLGLDAPSHWTRLDTFSFGAFFGAALITFLGTTP